jgi:predicted GIY-YIG superfamily endonuclease
MGHQLTLFKDSIHIETKKVCGRGNKKEFKPLIKEVLRYKTYKEFCKDNPKELKSIRRRGWCGRLKNISFQNLYVNIINKIKEYEGDYKILIKNEPIYENYINLYKKYWDHNKNKNISFIVIPLYLKKIKRDNKLENLIKLSKNYSSYKLFLEDNPNIYNSKREEKEIGIKLRKIFKERINNEYIDEIIYKQCLEASLKYKTKGEFSKNDKEYYKVAKKCGILNEICKHMDTSIIIKRMIYACLFEKTKHIYIGLTCNLKKRIGEHHSSKNSAVYLYINKTKIKPKILKLTDFINQFDASKQEEYFMKKYENDGYTLLNRCKGGNLGGGHNNTKWTKEKVLKICENYDSIIKFKKENRVAYQTACRLNYLNEVGDVIGYNRKPKNYWSLKNCIKGVLERNSYSDKRKENFQGGYYNIRTKFKIIEYTNNFYKTMFETIKGDQYSYKKNRGRNRLKISLVEYIINNDCNTTSEILYNIIVNKSTKKEIKNLLNSDDELTKNIYDIIKTLYPIDFENKTI